MPTLEAFGRADLGGQRPGPGLWPCSPQKLVRCSRDVGSMEEVASGGRRSSQEVSPPPGYAHLHYRKAKHNTVNIRFNGTLVHFVAHLVFQEKSSLTTATSCRFLDRANEMRSFRTIVRCCSLVRPQRSRSSQLYGRVPYNWDAYNRILTVLKLDLPSSGKWGAYGAFPKFAMSAGMKV